MPIKKLLLACLLTIVGGCGGSSSGGFGVGGATMCGQVSACGGDLTGTWNMTSGCITSIGIKDAIGTGNSACPGESVGVSNISVSGTITFNADMTYTITNIREQATYTLGVPQSCLGGMSCSTISSGLTSTGEFESATCLGSNGCSCTAVQTPLMETETGTYSVSGSNLTTVSSTGASSTVPYCVEGSIFHLLENSTMSMGPMGQAAIDEDTIGVKQ